MNKPKHLPLIVMTEMLTPLSRARSVTKENLNNNHQDKRESPTSSIVMISIG